MLPAECTVQSTAQASPKHGTGRLGDATPRSRKTFSRTCRTPPSSGHLPRPPVSRNFPQESGGAQRRANEPTAVTARDAEAMPIGAPPRWNFPGGLRPRAEANAGTRLSDRAASRARQIPADFQGNLGRAQAMPQADGGDAQPRQHFSTMQSRAAELPRPLSTHAARRNGGQNPWQSSSSQASTFSRTTRMAWGKRTGGCRKQRFTTRFRTGVNGANKAWSTCTRHQRHASRPFIYGCPNVP